MSYHQFRTEEGRAYGSFETFENEGPEDEPSWYWWPCFPGCLPECEPIGPFATEQEAIDDAQRA